VVQLWFTTPVLRVALFSLVLARAALAEEPVPSVATDDDTDPHDEHQSATPEPTKKADEVTVRGRTAPPSRGASDFQLKVGELARVPRANAARLLELAPGLFLANEGGEGHPEQIYLRGFDARLGQDLELTVGGVPVNQVGNLHGNGFADLHFVVPELVEALRVVEGPYDPRQGNFAVAGSANYELGLERRGLTTKVTKGSFGTERLLLSWGPEGYGRHTFAGGELVRSDGFGTNRSSQRGAINAQVEGVLPGTGTWRLLGTSYATHFSSAGLLRADDVGRGRVDFFGTYDPRQGGDATRHSVSFDVEERVADTTYRLQVFAVGTTLRLLENFTGFLHDPQEALQNLHTQRGDLLDLAVATKSVGLRASSRMRFKLLDLPQEVELGAYARGDDSDGQQVRREARTNAPYRVEADLQAVSSNLALYMDTSLKVQKWLTFRGGARAEYYGYDVLDRCAVQSVRQPSRTNPPGDSNCLTQQDQGRWREAFQRSTTAGSVLLPRASLLFGPFDDFTFSASWGRGARSVDPIYVSDGLATPFAELDSGEIGASWQQSTEAHAIALRAIGFRTHVDRDLLFDEVAGRNTLAQGTTRIGFVGSARYTTDDVDLSTSGTWVRATFDDTGLLVPYAPDLVLRFDGSYHRDLFERFEGSPLHGNVALGSGYVGRRALPYGQRSEVIFTVDGAASLGWKGLEATLSVQNLFDARYRQSEYVFPSVFAPSDGVTLVPSRHFAAGAPRTVLFTLGYTLGGAS
jgi:iron complex outermembrane recepter protein